VRGTNLSTLELKRALAHQIGETKQTETESRVPPISARLARAHSGLKGLSRITRRRMIHRPYGRQQRRDIGGSLLVR